MRRVEMFRYLHYKGRGLIPVLIFIVAITLTPGNNADTKDGPQIRERIAGRREVDSERGREAHPARESRVEFVKMGEVLALQKNKGVLRISASPRAIAGSGRPAALRKYFLETRPSLFLRDHRGRDIGSFICTRVEIEEGTGPGGGRRVTVFGFINIKQNESKRFLSIGFEAGYYRKYHGYLEPVHNTRPREPIRSIRHQIDGKIMLFIPESRLVYGQGHDPERDNFNPFFYQRDPWVVPKIAAFYIDKYEVTNREYWLFCQQSDHPPPPAWPNGRYPAGRGNHPITVASYDDAEAYARWSGKRLPTEFEWELAARGSLNLMDDGNGPASIRNSPPVYPFGNEFEKSRCNTIENRLGRTIPVTGTQDRSPFGVFGMCGNAREWTSSWYGPYRGHKFRKYPYLAGKQFRVIRGGSFAQSAEYARADSRDYGGFPDLNKDRSAGFRLVFSAR